MSLPTGKPPAVQSSIRSFFTAKPPNYAPPPSASSKSVQEVNGAQDLPSSTSAPPRAAPAPELLAPPPATSSAAIQTLAEIPALPSTLPPEASVRLINPEDLNALRRINALLLPVAYPDEFYKRLPDHSIGGGRYSRVITWTHAGESETKVVGGVVCRLEPQAPGSNAQTLYIRSLCLLSPYRSLGLVNAAVDNIVATVIADVGGAAKTVTAHVWTENEEGLKWYESRGFTRVAAPIKGYYLKLRPDSAWLVHRQITHGDASPSPTIVPAIGSSQAPEAIIRPSVTAAAVNLPPMSSEATRPPPVSGTSFQNRRAHMEWNDLPADMSSGLLPRKGASEPTSTASSRSSSTARKKRDRSYPAAAFGS